MTQRGSPAVDRGAVVRGDGVTVDRVVTSTEDIGVVEARRRFGGIDIPATLAGALAALGVAVLMGGLASRVARIGYQSGGRHATDVTAAGVVAGLVTVFLALLVGGWVAGRMARYDGGRNGLMAAVWFFILPGVMWAERAAFTRRGDAATRGRLPQWFFGDGLSKTTLVTGFLAIAVMLLAGWFGGSNGERYHREADALIARTRRGGVARPARPVAR
jgi:hypothetical protein